MSNIVNIEIEDLKARVQAGAKMKELAKHYDIPVTQMKDMLKQAGLRIRSFKTSLKRAVLITGNNPETIEENNTNQSEIPFEQSQDLEENFVEQEEVETPVLESHSEVETATSL